LRALYFLAIPLRCCAVLDRTATGWLNRLLVRLELFEPAFGRASQRGALRRYVHGVLSDSRRKSMEAMWARASATPAPIKPSSISLHMRRGARRPCGRGCARRYRRGRAFSFSTRRAFLSRAAHRSGHAAVLWCAPEDCQLPGGGDGGALDRCRGVAVGRDDVSARDVADPAQRTKGRIPATVQCQPKWQLALTLLRQVRAAEIELTAVVGDAEFGESAILRRALHRLRLPYALGASKTLTVFCGTPTLQPPTPSAGLGRPRRRPVLPPGTPRVTVTDLAAEIPSRRWRIVSWRNGSNSL